MLARAWHGEAGWRMRVKETEIQRKLRLIYRRHAALSAAQGFLEVARSLAQM